MQQTIDLQPDVNGNFGPYGGQYLPPHLKAPLMLTAIEGRSQAETAGMLGVSIKTVETHMSSVLRKLQLSNRSELTRWAADRRIV